MGLQVQQVERYRQHVSYLSSLQQQQQQQQQHQQGGMPGGKEGGRAGRFLPGFLRYEEEKGREGGVKAVWEGKEGESGEGVVCQEGE